PHGGTSDTTLTAHAELLGQGTSAVSSVGPCSSPGSPTTGIATVWPSSSVDPICGTVSVPGGGTGLQTLTNGCLLVGNGGNALNVVCPGTAGNVLTNVGGVWTSAAPSTGVGGSGTAHGVAIWTAPTTLGVVGPSSTNGLPLLNIGTTSDPVFGALNLSGSGTTGTLPTGKGGTNVASCGADGNLLVCSSGNWIAQAPASTLPSVGYGQGG